MSTSDSMAMNYPLDRTTLLAICLSCAFIILYILRKGCTTPAPLPPGPKGLPLLGNIADIPQSQQWFTYAKWGEIYGGIMHVKALGKTIIILNNSKHAINMLDKKGRLYSDRPTLVMAGQLVGWDQGPALIPMCSVWNEFRRLYFRFMGTRSKVDAFQNVFQTETNTYLKRVLDDPVSWVKHTYKLEAAIILKLTYGYHPARDEDHMVQLVNEAMDQFSETTASTAFLVDVLPILRHIPPWLPGTAWQKKVPKYRDTLQEMLSAPYDWVKQQIAAGTARPSFLSNILDEPESISQGEKTITWAAAGIYSGGADTTVAGIESFFLAMTLQISAQHEAQSEMDAVIGTDRLPTLADRERLPYFEAFFTETLRMYTMAPLGLAHVAQEDDIYEGYFIPKGSLVIANVWNFLKDPKTYANPGVFSPRRFIPSEGRPKETDPRKYVFGFGRRACPGIHLADASMWLTCASVLAAFEIRPPVQDGKPVLPSGKYFDGTISHPEPFECVIKPRSRTTETFIRAL